MNVQSRLEEKLNTITHAFGALLGLVGLALLLFYNTQNTTWTIFSVVIYGISVIVLFSVRGSF